jgi:hypothetical protein
MDWQMVWKEILIGVTIAGFVAVLVPAEWWSTLFLVEAAATLPGWLVRLENAALLPFVAVATFIGSMGNIPLATVLNANGVLFPGIMGFIYSDLMVPPLGSLCGRGTLQARLTADDTKQTFGFGSRYAAFTRLRSSTDKARPVYRPVERTPDVAGTRLCSPQTIQSRQYNSPSMIPVSQAS